MLMAHGTMQIISTIHLFSSGLKNCFRLRDPARFGHLNANHTKDSECTNGIPPMKWSARWSNLALDVAWTTALWRFDCLSAILCWWFPWHSLVGLGQTLWPMKGATSPSADSYEAVILSQQPMVNQLSSINFELFVSCFSVKRYCNYLVKSPKVIMLGLNSRCSGCHPDPWHSPFMEDWPYGPIGLPWAALSNPIPFMCIPLRYFHDIPYI